MDKTIEITPEMIDKAAAYLDDVLQAFPGTGKGHIEEILAIFEDCQKAEETHHAPKR